MRIRNWRVYLLLAALASLAACGKQERLEAVGFAKVLAAKQANFTSAGVIEKEFVDNARAWCGGITGSGSGHGPELDQNAVVASELAKSAMAASAQLSEIRQAIDAYTLQQEYPRSVRNALTTQLTRRQRMLQDVRAMLDDSAAQFRQYRATKSAGDTYPDGISKLVALLASYKPPEDALASALSALKSKYNLADGEI